MGKKQNTSGEKKENLKWTPPMDSLLIETMLYEKNQGNRLDGNFTSTANANMVNFLREKLGIPGLKKDHLKNRMKTLKENLTDCYNIFNPNNSSGFAWDPVTRMFEADDTVWADLIAKNSDAAKWKNKAINNYDALTELYAKDRANGLGAETAKEKRKRWAEINENEVTVDEIDDLVSQQYVTLDNLVDLDEFEVTTHTMKTDTQSNNGATSKLKLKRKKLFTNSIAEETASVSASIEKVAAVMNEGNKEFLNAMTALFSSSQERIYSPSKVYNELVEMKLEQPFLDEAYFWLSNNEKMIKTLFGFPPEKRVEGLQKMMNATKNR